MASTVETMRHSEHFDSQTMAVVVLTSFIAAASTVAASIAATLAPAIQASTEEGEASSATAIVAA